MNARTTTIASVTSLLLLLAVAACGDEGSIDNSQTKGPDTFGSANGSDANKPGANKNAGGDQSTREGFCASKGGVQLPSGTQCTADLAKKIFRFAVCSCDALDVSGSFESKSFDSAKAMENRVGGSVGTNAPLPSTGSLVVGGSLWTAKDLSVDGNTNVAQDVHALSIVANGSLQVGTDIYAGSAPSGNITLGGAKHVPSPVTEPCNCSDPPIAIPQFIDAFAMKNDNAVSKVTAASLVDPPSGSVFTLDCGRYYFDSVAVATETRLKITGRTAIFVKGNFEISGNFGIDMDSPNAELDLFVGGDVTLSGSSTFGSLAAPARMRVYVAGAKVEASGGGEVAANIYAPNALVVLSGGNDIRGAIHARKVDASGGLNINYDEAILSLQGCEAPKAPDSTCKTCNDCDAACTGGKCTACVTNADCCAPLQCSNGACIPSVR